MPFARWVLVLGVTVSMLLARAALAQESPPPAVRDGTPAVPPAALEASKAGGDQNVSAGVEEQHLSDLTLLNFFTEGWDQAWAHRHRHTPDMALLRVTTNFLEREFRLDYVFTAVNNNPKVLDTQLLNGLIAYGLDRRLMIEVISNYQWNVPPKGAPANGAAGGAVVRLQLIDTATASYAFNFKVATPNRGIGQTTTTMSYSLAGWQDMSALVPALGRLGMYYSFTYDNQLGFHKTGATLNDLAYVLSFAETWTDASTPVLGDFTTFLEFAGTTPLDGTNINTTLSLTPGIRFWFLPKNSLMFGIDFPLTSSPPYSIVYRLTYIMNF
jgi:hypothetical protein